MTADGIVNIIPVKTCKNLTGIMTADGVLNIIPVRTCKKSYRDIVLSIYYKVLKMYQDLYTDSREFAQSKHQGLEEDLGEYVDRENNILVIAILALLACFIAVFVLWWDPKPST